MELLGLVSVTNFGLVILADNALKLMENPVSSEALGQTVCAITGGLIAAAGACLGI